MKNKNLIRFSKLIFKKNKIKIIITFILVILVTVMDLFVPQLTKRILDDGITKGNMKLLLILVIAYFVVTIIDPLIQLGLEYLYTVMKNKVTVSLKVKLLKHLSCLSGRYFSDIKTGNLFSIINQDMYIIENFNADMMFSLITNAFTAVFSMVFMFIMSKDLFLIVVVIQVILVLAQNKIRKYISKSTADIRKSDGELSNILQEYVSNIKNIVISNSKLKFFKGYIVRERSLINKMLRLNVVMVGNISISRILTGAITVIIYGYGGYKIIKGQFTIGGLIAFQQYTGMMVGPCIGIIRTMNQIAQTKVSIDRVYSVIDEPIDIKVDNSAYKLNPEKIETLELKDVSFDYQSAGENNFINKEIDKKDMFYHDSNVLKNINMTFKKGETTAIVGESGCGKSTIVSLLYRLWDAKDGEILIDGLNIKDINLKSLRSNVHIVNQDVFLFDDTIRNNIDFNMKLSDKEVHKICSIVGLDDLLKSLEHGIHTVVGEKGVKISGGQKQRIQIARTLTSDCKIIVLDEATSSLDNISQSEVIKNIGEYIEDKIVIVIAHRLSTIRNADNIYVLEDGEVLESGNEDELLAMNGLYTKLSNAVN